MNDRKRKKKGIAVILLFGASFLMLLTASLSKDTANWYSERIYPVWVGSIGRFFGIFPFSVAEIMLYSFILACLFFTGRFIYRLLRRKQGAHDISDAVLQVLMTAALLFLIFTLTCGLNYQRSSFSEEYDLSTAAYDAEELARVCRILTEDVNLWGQKISRDQDGLAALGMSRTKERKEAVSSMQRLGVTYPALSGYYPKPKGLLFSEFLSFQSLTGIYSPFTVEANYNQDMSSYNIPFTMCHELSHLRGFMQEEEANFIAYLACMESEFPEFRYSASLMGWIYCMNVLLSENLEMYEEIRSQLLPAAKVDLTANSVFWEQYEGMISEVTDKVNDTYLKANGQADGVKSYDRMVDLLVAYYK